MLKNPELRKLYLKLPRGQVIAATRTRACDDSNSELLDLDQEFYVTRTGNIICRLSVHVHFVVSTWPAACH